jgi:hypothetical protein
LALRVRGFATCSGPPSHCRPSAQDKASWRGQTSTWVDGSSQCAAVTFALGLKTRNVSKTEQRFGLPSKADPAGPPTVVTELRQMLAAEHTKVRPSSDNVSRASRHTKPELIVPEPMRNTPSICHRCRRESLRGPASTRHAMTLPSRWTACLSSRN